ncbi:MAG: Brp/Blh family beta-carotene 15,15'-dioxygenase, partial [Janthinobacterium lividum]
GLPHGAVDHLVPFWTGWVRRSALSMLVVLAGYVFVAVLTWVELHWGGSVVLPLLLVVSVLHFGAGDLMADRDDDPTARPLSGVELTIAVLACGGPVVAGPLLVWPEQAGRALAGVQLDFVMPDLWVRVLLAGVVAACVLTTASAALRRGHLRPAAEVVILALLFVTVPPLAAFGIYFGVWHGLRHTARLVARDPRNHADLAAGELLLPLRRFGVSAALPTLVAGGSAAALVVVAGQHTGLTGTVFTVLLALTVPHLVVVAALDLVGLRRPGRQPTALAERTRT